MELSVWQLKSEVGLGVLMSARALEKMIFKMSFNIKFTHQYNFCIWNYMQSFNLTPFSVMEDKVQKEE